MSAPSAGCWNPFGSAVFTPGSRCSLPKPRLRSMSGIIRSDRWVCRFGKKKVCCSPDAWKASRRVNPINLAWTCQFAEKVRSAMGDGMLVGVLSEVSLPGYFQVEWASLQCFWDHLLLILHKCMFIRRGSIHSSSSAEYSWTSLPGSISAGNLRARRDTNDTGILILIVGWTTRRGWWPLVGRKKWGSLTCLHILTRVCDSSHSYLDLTFDQKSEDFISTEFPIHNLWYRLTALFWGNEIYTGQE